MEIRTEDVRAIVTAVEWIVEGALTEVRIRRRGETIFAARLNGDALQIDPDVMPAELARRLIEDTELLGGESDETNETSTSPTTSGAGRPASGRPEAKAAAGRAASSSKARV